MVDVFNLFNSSVVLRRVTTNGPNYNKPLVDRRHRRRVGESDSRGARFPFERALPILIHGRLATPEPTAKAG